MCFILKFIAALVFPPIAAGIQVGFSTHFWINCILTLLGYFPGLAHAVWLIWTEQEAD